MSNSIKSYFFPCLIKFFTVEPRPVAVAFPPRATTMAVCTADFPPASPLLESILVFRISQNHIKKNICFSTACVRMRLF